MNSARCGGGGTAKCEVTKGGQNGGDEEDEVEEEDDHEFDGGSSFLLSFCVLGGIGIVVVLLLS